MIVTCRAKNCGAELDLDAAFCWKCGAKTTQDCISCGASMQPGEVFCSECGHNQTLPVSKDTKKKKPGKDALSSGLIARRVDSEEFLKSDGQFWDGPQKLKIPTGHLAFVIEKDEVKFVRPPGLKKVADVEQDTTWKKMWHFFCAKQFGVTEGQRAKIEEERLPNIEDCTVYLVRDTTVPISFNTQVPGEENKGDEKVKVMCSLSMAVSYGDKHKANDAFFKKMLKGKKQLHTSDVVRMFRSKISNITDEVLSSSDYVKASEPDYGAIERVIQERLNVSQDSNGKNKYGPIAEAGFTASLTIVPEGKLGTHEFILGDGVVPVTKQCVGFIQNEIQQLQCADCSTPLTEEERFCHNCGSQTKTIAMIKGPKEKCTFELATGEVFCPICGTKQPVTSQTDNPNQTGGNVPLLTADAPPQRMEFRIQAVFAGAHALESDHAEKIEQSLLGTCAAFAKQYLAQDLELDSTKSKLRQQLERAHSGMFRAFGLRLTGISVVDVRSKDKDWKAGADADMALVKQQIELSREWDAVHKKDQEYELERTQNRWDFEDKKKDMERARMVENQDRDWEHADTVTDKMNTRQLDNKKRNNAHDIKDTQVDNAHEINLHELEAEHWLFKIKKEQFDREVAVKKEEWRLQQELELMIVAEEGNLQVQQKLREFAERNRQIDLDHKFANADMDVQEEDKSLETRYMLQQLKIKHANLFEEYELSQEEEREVRFQERQLRKEIRALKLREQQQDHLDRTAKMDVADAVRDVDTTKQIDGAQRDLGATLRARQLQEDIDVATKEHELDRLKTGYEREKQKDERTYNQGEEEANFDHQAKMEKKSVGHDQEMTSTASEFVRSEHKAEADFGRQQKVDEAQNKADLDDIERNTAEKDRDFENQTRLKKAATDSEVARSQIDTDIYGQNQDLDIEAKKEKARQQSLKFETELVEDIADRQTARDEGIKDAAFNREQTRDANKHNRAMEETKLHQDHQLKVDGTFEEREGTFAQRSAQELKMNAQNQDHEARMREIDRQADQDFFANAQQIRAMDIEVEKAEVDKDKAIGLAEQDAKVKVAEAAANADAREAKAREEAAREAAAKAEAEKEYQREQTRLQEEKLDQRRQQEREDERWRQQQQMEMMKQVLNASTQNNQSAFNAISGQQAQQREREDKLREEAREAARRGSDRMENLTDKFMETQTEQVRAVTKGAASAGRLVDEARQETVNTAKDSAKQVIDSNTNVAGARAGNTSAFGGAPPPPPMPSETEYRYAYDGADKGQKSETEVVEAVMADPEGQHSVWRPEFGNWKSWRDVPAIANRVNIPPSKPPSAPSAPVAPPPSSGPKLDSGQMGFALGNEAAKRNAQPEMKSDDTDIGPICHACSAPLRVGAKFCTACGATQ